MARATTTMQRKKTTLSRTSKAVRTESVSETSNHNSNNDDRLRREAMKAAALCCVSFNAPSSSPTASTALSPASTASTTSTTSTTTSTTNAAQAIKDLRELGDKLRFAATATSSAASSAADQKKDRASVDAASGALTLGQRTVSDFRARLRQKAALFESTHVDPAQGIAAFAQPTFAKAARRYLQQTESLPANFQSDFAVAVLLVIATNTKHETDTLIAALVPKPTPAESDSLFLSTILIFIATLHEVICSEAAPTTLAAATHKFFSHVTIQNPTPTDLTYIRVALRKFLYAPLDDSTSTSSTTSSTTSTSQDATLDTSLLEYLRILIPCSDQDFIHLRQSARSSGTRDLAYSCLLAYKDRLDKCDTEIPNAPMQDFKSSELWEEWRKVEAGSVGQWCKVYQLSFSNLKKSIPTQEQEDMILPPGRFEYYKYLLKLCVQHDVKTPFPPTGIPDISKRSYQLLSQCAQRWRLTKEWRELALMEVLIGFFSDNIVGLGDIQNKMFWFIDYMTDNCPRTRWSEDNEYAKNLNALRFHIQARFTRLGDLAREGDRDWANRELQSYVAVYIRISQDYIIRHYFPSDPNEVVEDTVQGFIVDYIVDQYQKNSARLYPNEELGGLVKLTRWIRGELDMYHMFFRDPVCGRFRVGFMAEDIYVKRNFFPLLSVLQYIHLDFTLEQKKDAMNLVLGPEGLYSVVSELFSKLDPNLFDGKPHDIEEFFRPFIEDWLETMKEQWTEWASNAIKNDDFIPILAPTTMYSSSIRDIFGFFNNGLMFVKKLKDGSAASKRREALVVSFLRLMGKSLMEFAGQTCKEFDEMARVKNDKQPVDFQPRQCIKLNNIVGAIRHLKMIFAELNISEGSKMISASAIRSEPDAPNMIVDISIVRAFNLPAADSYSTDPYAYISISGQRAPEFTTHRVERNLNPVWNRNFKFKMDPEMARRNFFDFEICHDSTFIKNQVVARTKSGDSFSLQDRLFQDFLTHEFEMELEPQGKLVVRVLRNGEIGDRQFWVEKCMQTLKYTGETIVRVMMNQMIRFAEAEWVKVSQSFKGGLFKGNRSTSPSSPAFSVVDEAKVEVALLPLLQYLDTNLTLMNQNLDRPLLDEFLRETYPSYFQVEEQGNGSEDLLDELSLEQQKQSQDRPSMISLVLWNELLIRMKSSLETIRSKKATGERGAIIVLGDAEKKQVSALEFVMEFLKAFFYCDLDGRCCGFSLKVLETRYYREVRSVVRSLLG